MSILSKDSHFYKEKDTISNTSYLYTVTRALLVQPDIKMTHLREYQCSSAKKAGQDLTRPQIEVLTPVHKRQIEDNSEKQASLPQVWVKGALRITDQNCACNRITSEAVKKMYCNCSQKVSIKSCRLLSRLEKVSRGMWCIACGSSQFSSVTIVSNLVSGVLWWNSSEISLNQ